MATQPKVNGNEMEVLAQMYSGTAMKPNATPSAGKSKLLAHEYGAIIVAHCNGYTAKQTIALLAETRKAKAQPMWTDAPSNSRISEVINGKNIPDAGIPFVRAAWAHFGKETDANGKVK